MNLSKKILTTALASIAAAALFTACSDPNVAFDNTTAQIKVNELPKSQAKNTITKDNLSRAQASFAVSGAENVAGNLFNSVFRSVQDQILLDQTVQDASRSINKKTSDISADVIINPSYFMDNKGIITINEEDVNLDKVEAVFDQYGFKGVGLSLARLYVYTDLLEDDPDNTKTDYTAEARVEAAASYTAQDTSKTIIDAVKAQTYCNAKADLHRNLKTNEYIVSGKGRASAAAGVTLSDGTYGGRLVCNVSVTYDVNKVKLTKNLNDDDVIDLLTSAKASLIWYDDNNKPTYTVFEAKNLDQFKASYNQFYAQSKSSIAVIPGADVLEATINAGVSGTFTPSLDNTNSSATNYYSYTKSWIDFFDRLF